MGAVYLAEHQVMERPVALKVIRPDLTARPELVERFRREARAVAQLAHPNIVAAYDAEQAGDCHFLVMEYVEGTDLARWLKGHSPLPTANACGYIRQAALGLQHAHERHLVHRDLKPRNLMRLPSGQVKILDFGLALLARSAGDAETEAGVIVGTPDYMAPEQANDAHAADIRADIYSLGCTLYELLSGRPPFPGGGLLDKLRRQAAEEPTPLAQLRPDLPAALVGVVAQMMAKDPARRYQTPAEVASALEPWCGPLPETTDLSGGPFPPEQTAPGRRSRFRWVAAFAGIAALVLLAGGFLAYLTREHGQQPAEPPSTGPAGEVGPERGDPAGGGPGAGPA
jgi:serine/threonine-protein kinase